MILLTAYLFPEGWRLCLLLFLPNNKKTTLHFWNSCPLGTERVNIESYLFIFERISPANRLRAGRTNSDRSLSENVVPIC